MSACLSMVLCFLLLSKVSAACTLSHYNGTVSVTNGGRGCQRWDRQTPHRHGFTSSLYFQEDGAIYAAVNYCRQPDNDSLPWCFSTDKYTRWQFCDQQICGEVDGVCGGNFSAKTGLLHPIDLDNDGFYDNDQDCLWTLSAIAYYVIELQFQEFDLEYNYVCGFDFVMIYEDSVVHGRFCGTKSPPVIRSLFQILYVRFLSDEESQAKGFTANYSQVTLSTEEVTNENSTSYESYVSGELSCPGDVDLLLYSGDVAVANNGNPCFPWVTLQEWAGHDREKIQLGGTITAARNYCRSICRALPCCLTIHDNYVLEKSTCEKNICYFTDPQSTPARKTSTTMTSERVTVANTDGTSETSESSKLYHRLIPLLLTSFYIVSMIFNP